MDMLDIDVKNWVFKYWKVNNHQVLGNTSSF